MGQPVQYPLSALQQYDHEGGIHTPMIAHWPNGIKGKGTTSSTLSHLVDLMPTILEATAIRTIRESGGAKRIKPRGRSIDFSFSAGQEAT